MRSLILPGSDVSLRREAGYNWVFCTWKSRAMQWWGSVRGSSATGFLALSHGILHVQAQSLVLRPRAQVTARWGTTTSCTLLATLRGARAFTSRKMGLNLESSWDDPWPLHGTLYLSGESHNSKNDSTIKSKWLQAGNLENCEAIKWRPLLQLKLLSFYKNYYFLIHRCPLGCFCSTGPNLTKSCLTEE